MPAPFVTRRTAVRVGCEVVAVVLWPAQFALCLVLPLLPLVAVVVADLERDRARRCGEDVAPYHRAAGSWGAWIRTRIRDRGVWTHDVPVTLGSLLLGAVALFVTMFGVLAGLILLASPVFWHGWGIGVSVGTWTVADAFQAWLAVPFGVVALVLTLWALLLVSMCRDVALRVLGGDERARMERELGVVRTSRASILEAFEAERRRIERDLHDGAQQDLVALTITLGLLEHRLDGLEATGDAQVRELVTRAHAQADRSLVRLRETVRGIHPRELTDHGLAAALGELGDRSPLDVRVSVTGDDARLPSPVAGALYFVAAEALTNVARHAGVEAAVLRLDISEARARIDIEDRGGGGAVVGDGTGLAGLRERLRGLDGELTLRSARGEGTTVTARVPLDGPGTRPPTASSGPAADGATLGP